MDALRADGPELFDWQVEKTFTDQDEALAYEKTLIAERHTQLSGFNTAVGGFRTGGRKRTDSEKEHLRQKTHEWQSNTDWGAHISTKLKTFYNSTEEGAAQLARRKEVANRPDVRAKMSASHGGRPIEALKDGVVVNVYLTQGECSREMGISHGNLNSCLHGRPGCKSLRGHTFRFAETPTAGV